MSKPTVTLGWNLPAPARKEDLIAVLENALEHIRDDDSFEGHITWVVPTDEPWLYPEGTEFDDTGFPRDGAQSAEFGLIARYRVGNSEGQGGLRAFTVNVPEDQLGHLRGNPIVRGPSVPEAVKLVRDLAALDDDVKRRATITLQQIIDRAKSTLPPE